MKIFFIVNFVIAALYWIVLILIYIVASKQFQREKEPNITYINPKTKIERFAMLIRVLIISIIPILNLILFLVALFNFDECVQRSVDTCRNTFNKIES